MSNYDSYSNRLNKIFQAHNISSEYLTILLENASPLPYHNLEHCIQVSERAAFIAKYFHQPQRNQVLAGLFHDLKHLGPGVPDSENVSLAVDLWEKASSGIESKETIEAVSRLIASTEYPYTPTLSLDEKIIRTADLTQSINPKWNQLLELERGSVSKTDFLDKDILIIDSSLLMNLSY